jgi:hypothetical protein
VALREKLNQQNPVVIASSVGALIVVIILLIFFTMRGEGGKLNGPRYRPDKDFFSDDEGHTFFIDDSNKIPPFQHNGRPAYRAVVFLDSNDKKFVGYLESYDQATKEKMESELKSGKSLADVKADNPPNIKNVAGGGWVKPKPGSVTPSLEYARAMIPVPPDKKAKAKSARLFVSEADVAEQAGH